MEALDAVDVERPSLPVLERVVEYGVSLRRLRVFADLWEAARLFDCGCSVRRAARLEQMNRTQAVPAAIVCEHCSI